MDCFGRVQNAAEKTNEASAREKVELLLSEYRILKTTENKDFGEFLEEKKINKVIDEYNKPSEGSTIWTVEIDGYTFDINEKTLKIESVGKAGIRPRAKITFITEGYVFTGNKIEFSVDVELPNELSEAKVTIEAPEGVETTNNNKYRINTNGTYTFTIKAEKNVQIYTTTAIATVDKILDKPQISITDEKSTEFTINVTNNYPEEANVTFVYYVENNAETEKISEKSYKKEGLEPGTSYAAKVKAYTGNANYKESDTITAQTKGTEIRTLADLKNIANNMSGKYQLMNDIDVGSINWSSIRVDDSSSNYNAFTGTLDGNGFVIKNLTASYGNANTLCLFQSLSGATIKNLGIVDVNVTASQTFAGFTNYTKNSVIQQCYITGTAKKGTCFSESLSKVIDCYSELSNNSGHIMGSSKEGDIRHFYYNGHLTGNYNGTVGLFGNKEYSSEKFVNGMSYYNSTRNTTINANFKNFNGLSDQEMKMKSNYSGWDFDKVWYIDDENPDYPKLRVFLHE